MGMSCRPDSLLHPLPRALVFWRVCWTPTKVPRFSLEKWWCCRPLHKKQRSMSKQAQGITYLISVWFNSFDIMILCREKSVWFWEKACESTCWQTKSDAMMEQQHLAGILRVARICFWHLQNFTERSALGLRFGPQRALFRWCVWLWRFQAMLQAKLSRLPPKLQNQAETGLAQQFWVILGTNSLRRCRKSKDSSKHCVWTLEKLKAQVASHSCPSALATLSNLFKLVSLLGRNAESNSAVRNWNVQKLVKRLNIAACRTLATGLDWCGAWDWAWLRMPFLINSLTYRLLQGVRRRFMEFGRVQYHSWILKPLYRDPGKHYDKWKVSECEVNTKY